MHSYLIFACRILLLLAFFTISANEIRKFNLISLNDSKLNAFTPYATTDSIIKELLAQADPQLVPLLDRMSSPTEAIRSAISLLPKNGVILFVGRPQDPGYLQMRLIICYLSWPHPVYAPSCNWPTSWDPPPDTVQISGTIYYLTPPPSQMTVVKEAVPRIYVTTSPEQLPWDSYCAQ